MNIGRMELGLLQNCFETANIPGKYVEPGDSTAAEQAAEALGEGKPVMFYGNYKASGNYHAVVLLGADKDGSIIIYNPGPGKIENYGSSSSFGKNMDEFFATYFQHWIYIPDEVPTGVKKKNKNAYVGYKGNEAVVSPVTGILLEYGTYDDSSKQKDERTNVDLKYGNKLLENEEGSEIVDKVGYAKIMVLDAEHYRKLEAISGSYWASSDKSLVNLKSGNEKRSLYVNDSELKTTKDLEDESKWTEINKTVYGYKEFAEKYEVGGISGNIIYLDGFVCQDVDENIGEDDIESKIPEGEPITKEDFMKTDLEDKDSLRKSAYSSDGDYKSISKEQTELIKAENKVKKSAASSYMINDNGKNLIYIKEGTVLGRTMTDKELLEASYLRNGQYGTYDEKRNSEDKEKNEVIGNYLRMVFRDKEDSVIENVEDYLKPGKTEPDKTEQEYKAWEGDVEILAECIHFECSYDCVMSSARAQSNKDEADFEMYCMGYSVVNKLLEQNRQYYGHLYDLSRTDRSPLAQVVTSAWYGVRGKMEAFINGGPSHYSAEELEYAEYCLTYDCTSIKKPMATELDSSAISCGYTATSNGTVIPRCMCQQGQLGDGAPGQDNIILVGFYDNNGDNKFGTFDEIFGVDRSMEYLIEEQ